LPANEGKINIKFPDPPKSGKMNIELISIKKSYGSKTIFNGLNFQVNRGEKIAFVGPNGAGKTTLANILAGKLDFESGERNLGHNSLISNYAQDVADNLQPEINIIETVDEIAENKSIRELRSILGAFLFRGDDVFKKVGVLSGGEKSRVALSKILLTKSNFIILDEPTNHLDISSRKVLQQALINFSGSLILVSHDVDFLRPIVNKVIEIRKGEIKIFGGGIDYYLVKREESSKGTPEKIFEKKNETVIAKKVMKRLEAEKRQAKYTATKKINSMITETERNIELLEEKEKKLDLVLAEPKTYNDNQKAIEINKELSEVKNELKNVLSEWENLTEELIKVKSQFE